MSEKKETTAPPKEPVRKLVRRKTPTADAEARASPKEAVAEKQEVPDMPKAAEPAVAEQVVLILLEQLRPFKNHPFKVRDDDELIVNAGDKM